MVGIVETDTVFRRRVIPIPLRFAETQPRRREMGVVRARLHRLLYRQVRFRHRAACDALELEGVVVDLLTRLIKSSLLALWHFMQDVSAVWRGLVIQWEVNFLTPSRI